MSQENIFKLQTDPADFSVMVSAMFTIAREMGKNMERTARAPIYYSAHDFTTTLLTMDCELLALAEYIPVLIGATPFSARAVKEFFKDTDQCRKEVSIELKPYIYLIALIYRGKRLVDELLQLQEGDPNEYSE